MIDDDLVPIMEARKRVNVPFRVLSDEVRAGRLPVYRTIRDRRQRLVSMRDVERLLQPRRVEIDDAIAA